MPNIEATNAAVCGDNPLSVASGTRWATMAVVIVPSRKNVPAMIQNEGCRMDSPKEYDIAASRAAPGVAVPGRAPSGSWFLSDGLSYRNGMQNKSENTSVMSANP